MGAGAAPATVATGEAIRLARSPSVMMHLDLTDDELTALQELVRSEYVWWWKRSRHARTALDRERAAQSVARLAPLCEKLKLDLPRP